MNKDFESSATQMAQKTVN